MNALLLVIIVRGYLCRIAFYFGSCIYDWFYVILHADYIHFTYNVNVLVNARPCMMRKFINVCINTRLKDKNFLKWIH